MKRALLSQIKNDWKENVWLVVELLIVAFIIWWLSLALLRTYRDTRIPLGADVTDVYAAQIDHIDTDGNSIDRTPPTEEILARLTEKQQAMLDRVRNLPMVEAAALGNNCLPYNYNYIGNVIHYLDGKDTLQAQINTRSITPEGALVLRFESTVNQTHEELRKRLEAGEYLFGAPSSFELYWKKDPKRALGQLMLDSAHMGNKIGGVIEHIRRNDYEINMNSGTLIVPLREHTQDVLEASTLLVRVKPGTAKAFEDAMRSEPALVAPDEIALSNFRPLSLDKRLVTWNISANEKVKVAGIFFLLAIVFIGLLGTFWYRVSLRTPEIAVRKTFGATDTDIFRRFVSEALLLLLIAIILDVALCFCFLDSLKTEQLEYVLYYPTGKLDILLSVLFTVGIMALMILIGVGIPARRAMKIEPAIALKED